MTIDERRFAFEELFKHYMSQIPGDVLTKLYASYITQEYDLSIFDEIFIPYDVFVKPIDSILYELWYRTLDITKITPSLM